VAQNGTTATAPANTKQIALDGAASKFKEWMEAEAELKAIQVKVDALKAEFRATLRTLGAGAGTFRGVSVLAEVQTKTFRGGDFARERPDLVEQYTKPVVVDRLDLVALEREQPRVYADYLSRQLRPDWRAFAAALAAATPTVIE